MSYRRSALTMLAVGILAVVLAACSATAAPMPPLTPMPAPTAMSTPVPTTIPALTPATTPASSAGAGGGGNRVSGSVASIAADKITLADGTIITTTAQTRVSRLVVITPADLKTGLFVAVTAKRQTDNTLLASAVNVFDESLRGVGVGQRPMTGGNLMTNATIDQVTGDTFTVTWDGGGAKIKLAPDAKIGKIVIGSLADIKEGATISASVTNGVAQSVSLQ